MDMLVVMSITAAYFSSVIAFSFEMADQPLEEGQFFETSTMLVALVLLGRSTAAFARVQAVAAVALRSRQDSTALARLPGKNTVTDISQLVEETANSKPQLQELANKVAGWLVPTMAVVAILVLVIWVACGIKMLRYSGGRAVGNAITHAVATLAVACPRALG
ncbi:hypothetical protein S40293_08778 [Stachybotrys chartarum IBT 40293]|nr:hypothetical protein S40293_08778 [Stachybotrys chartarum IBT 40293]